MYMAKKVIITISRQYGSGGKIIGEKLAEELGIVCYDKLFLENITKKLGVSSAFFQDDNRGENGLYEVGSHGPLSKVASLSVNNKVFESAAKLIREIAAKESAVIVGRCGHYSFMRIKRSVCKEESSCIILILKMRKKQFVVLTASVLISMNFIQIANGAPSLIIP